MKELGASFRSAPLHSMYYISNKRQQAKDKLCEPFSPSTISMTRGQPHTNCLPWSFFFSVRVINDWNSLPQSVITANSANQFKNLLDRRYLDVMYNF